MFYPQNTNRWVIIGDNGESQHRAHSSRIIDTCWYCVGCVDSGRLPRSGCGYDSAAW